MLSALFAGVTFGLAAGLAPGPLMALVISHALRHDAKAGTMVALAPLVTDVPLVVASLVAVRWLAGLGPALGIVAAIGASYVLYLAYETLNAEPLASDHGAARARSLGQGVLVNVLNPHPYLFWGTVGGPLILQLHRVAPLAPWLFIAAFYAFLVGTKIFIAVAADRFRPLLAGMAYVRIMRALGLTMAVFAALLFAQAFRLLGHGVG